MNGSEMTTHTTSLNSITQSLKAYKELLGNPNMHLSHKKLIEIIKVLLKRVEELNAQTETR
jgi:hypothetical protein